jgi:hypothetical protein
MKKTLLANALKLKSPVKHVTRAMNKTWTIPPPVLVLMPMPLPGMVVEGSRVIKEVLTFINACAPAQDTKFYNGAQSKYDFEVSIF